MKDNFDIHNWNKNRYLDKLNENKSHLEFLSKYLGSMHPNLRFNVSDHTERIDVRGSQQDMMDWGNENHGKKFGEFEVFHVDDDDRGEIVRIVKSDSILRENVEEGVVKDMHTFLNDLRDSGVTNMFGAAPYLQKEFGIDQKSAREVLANWMQSFSENLQYKDRKLSHEEEDRLDLIAHREFDGVSFSKLSDEDKAKVFAQRDKVGVKESITKKEDDEFAGSDPKSGSTIKGTGFMAPRQKPKVTQRDIDDIESSGNIDIAYNKALELLRTMMDKDIKGLEKLTEEELQKIAEEMCKRGKNYMAARKRAGEKSSAYLSGRGVKVCKGQIKGSDGKKKKSY
jgi:hypothetical protein